MFQKAILATSLLCLVVVSGCVRMTIAESQSEVKPQADAQQQTQPQTQPQPQPQTEVTVVGKGYFQDIDDVLKETNTAAKKACHREADKLEKANLAERNLPTIKGDVKALLEIIQASKTILDELFLTHTYTKTVKCTSN